MSFNLLPNYKANVQLYADIFKTTSMFIQKIVMIKQKKKSFFLAEKIYIIWRS